ncbi:MAG: AAA family ATPase [Acidimicrobiales bacterium]
MERRPYRFGAPVEPPWFCDRETELQFLTARMAGGIHVFVLSPRRYGKTSLVKRAVDLVGAEGGRCAYANLLFATNEIELATTILQAVVRGLLGPVGRTRHSLESILRQLRVTPTVTVGPDGSVSLGLDAAAVGASWLDVVGDALTLLQQAAERRPAVLVLDEFQVVAGIGRKGVGGAFKALADEAAGTSIVFSGSHLAVMEHLTKGTGAPLHGMGERLVLDVVPEEPMVAYLQRRARAAGKGLDKAAGRLVYHSADTVPNYVQQLALASFEAAGTAGAIVQEHVAEGFETVVDREASSFAQQFGDLGGAPSQQRILKALARRPTASVYAKAFLDAVGVANANAVTTALRALDGRELVGRKGLTWDVADPFLRRWLTRG